MKQSSVGQREPLFHIARRDSMPAAAAYGIRVGAFLLALLLNALFVFVVVKVDPITFYRTMLRGAFGSKSYIWATCKATAKLLCIAVALAPAFKMQFWNIGAEGQVLIGGMAAAFIMHEFSSMPTLPMLLLMVIFSVIAGGIWGLIPAFFKAKMNTNETLFTLMMNYIAMNIVNYFYNTWRGAKSALGMINQQTQKGWLRSLWGGDVTPWLKNEDLWYVVIVLVITVLMYFYLRSTKQGYEIAVVGESQNTARYAGISVRKVVLRTMILSGAICGFCGCLTVSAQSHTIASGLAGGYGFTAIIVAWLSKFNTFTMAGVSLLIVALEKGASLMANTYSSVGFSASAADVMVGVMLLVVIGSEFFIRYRVMFRTGRKERAAA